MAIETELTVPPEAIPKATPPVLPSSSAEFINSLVHYYRGEMARMTSWRDRLDRTTNWAITGAGAMLSVSLSTPDSHHGVMLFAMLLVFLLMEIESRRYRFFDVYRSRVRLIERNYYARIFSPAGAVDQAHWMMQLSNDLRLPRFSMTHGEAVARRLRRNYIWLFLIILLAWVLKTTTSVLQPGQVRVHVVHSAGELFQNAAIGYIPGWLVLLSVLVFYGWLFYVILSNRKMTGELAYGEVHV